jgi:hypothetical protein
MDLPASETRAATSSQIFSFATRARYFWGRDANFDRGLMSIDLIRLKWEIENRMKVEISIFTMIQYLTIWSLAIAPGNLGGPKSYNPVIIPQHEGTKAQLWLIHLA